MLHTPFEKDGRDVPFTDYPRPQLVRDSYWNLNGKWELTVCSADGTQKQYAITVPFVPESVASGVAKTFQPDDTFVYTKFFSLPDGFVKDRVILHFGAVDQQAQVYVNDALVAEHTGGYLPFSCDITAALCKGDNRLTVRVQDPLDTDLPYGKQRRKRGGMWYTPVSGIWQTVWMESVPKVYIRSLRITPTLDSVTIAVDGGVQDKTLVCEGKTYTFAGDTFTLQVEHPIHWTPDTPHLYTFTLQAGEDTVTSYFALRTVTVGQTGGYSRLFLNGKPYFFNGLLDQGYFADGIYLPSDEEGYRFDIRTAKALGFNMLRKHIKIEPDVFYYECDRLGMIVFQDMVNNGTYRFLLDTALPTVGVRRALPRYRSQKQRSIFEQHCRDTVAQLYNHPCVCYYTVFNEGWGQFDADRLYREMKAIDNTRIWDATSGWFFGKDSDVQSEHVYFKPVKLKAGDKPLVLSEFGGYSYKIPEHAFSKEATYGYRYYNDAALFSDALFSLYRQEILPAVQNGLCAAVLTQLSDVEDETNGLVTYDRQVIKVDQTAMRAVCKEIYDAFKKQNNT